MTQRIGLQTWGADGKPIVDYTSYVWNVYGSFYTNDTGGSVSNTNITTNTKFIVASATFNKRSADKGNYQIDSPSISVANGKISWSIPTSGQYWTKWFILYGE